MEAEPYPYMSTCGYCGRPIAPDTGYGEMINGIPPVVLVVAQEYCSIRCAREHARRNRQSEHDNRDQITIFDVKGV
jgi:alkylhydroperoxidase family enzyme